MTSTPLPPLLSVQKWGTPQKLNFKQAAPSLGGSEANRPEAVTVTYLKQAWTTARAFQRLRSWTVVTWVLDISSLTHKNHTQNKTQLLLIFLVGPLFLSSLQKTMTLKLLGTCSLVTPSCSDTWDSAQGTSWTFYCWENLSSLDSIKQSNEQKRPPPPWGQVESWGFWLPDEAVFPETQTMGCSRLICLESAQMSTYQHRISQCSSQSHLEAQTCCIKWPLLGERSCRHSRDHSILGPEGPGSPLIFNEPCCVQIQELAQLRLKLLFGSTALSRKRPQAEWGCATPACPHGTATRIFSIMQLWALYYSLWSNPS